MSRSTDSYDSNNEESLATTRQFIRDPIETKEDEKIVSLSFNSRPKIISDGEKDFLKWHEECNEKWKIQSYKDVTNVNAEYRKRKEEGLGPNAAFLAS